MAAEPFRHKVARFRARWKAHQRRLDPKGLIFIDETWIKTSMTRAHGGIPRGQRLTVHVPHGHWKTLPSLVGLRRDRIVAPFVLDGPINGDSFAAWVEPCLAPTLTSGDIVIADDLGSRKGLPARQLIRNAGAHLSFLPPWSPELNPIEMVFAKLETLFRKANERTMDAAWQRVETLLDNFTSDECRNCLRHAGYASVQIRQALAQRRSGRLRQEKGAGHGPFRCFALAGIRPACPSGFPDA